MYAFLRGQLVESSPSTAIIECAGVAYEVNIPSSTFHDLPEAGSEVQLWTAFVIREQLQALYGFLSRSDKDLFEVLVGVSGIGPKTALAIIGTLSRSELQTAVREQDLKAMCRIPGIGKKTAERLILEIRDKLPSLVQREMDEQFSSERGNPETQLVADAMSALINLGFVRSQAQSAIKSVLDSKEETPELGQLITGALQSLQ